MDKFDDIIRNAVEGYEAPFSPSAWSSLNEKLNDASFESGVKSAVENFEAPYNASAWMAVSSQLGDMAFESSIQESVENFEAPYNASAWDAISNQLDKTPFENAIRESVGQFEAPYNAAAWSAVSGELDNAQFEETIRESVENYAAPINTNVWDAIVAQLGPSHSVLRWILGSAAVATLVAGGAYLLTNEEILSADETVVVAGNDLYKNETSTDETIVPDNSGTNDHSNQVTENISDLSIENSESLITNSNEPIDVENGVYSNDEHQYTNTEVNRHEVNHLALINENDGNDTEDNSGTSETHNYSAEFELTSQQCCAGQNVTFAALYGDQNCQYVWQFADGITLYGAEVEHKFTEAGVESVSLELRNNKNNNVLASEQVDVTVNALPDVSFTWKNSVDAVIPALQFINTTEDYASLSWNVSGQRTTNLREFEHTFRTKGAYFVELTAINDAGCQSNSVREINISEDYNLLAPAGFTPNGDGRNDNFIPAALTILENEFTMTIWSPERGLVYQTRNASEPWDGRITSDNTMARDGGYVWQVQLVNANGETEFYQGTVILTK